MLISAKNLDFSLDRIAETFDLANNDDCGVLHAWLSATFELNPFEHQIVNDLHEEVNSFGEYMNEEELKTKMVSLLFYAARIEVPKKVKVFYERPLEAYLNDIHFSVICDCVVATPSISAPKKPYFFLQEFKKAKGEKKDPEAQMLVAMLIAQAKNNDSKPIYGGYLIGTGWHFTTLIDKDYCVSRKYEATNKIDLLQIVNIIRKLKDFVLNE